MPDRRRRTAFRLPLPERSPLLMRERQSSSPDSSAPDSSSATGSSAGKPQEDNPFAPPPADRPDQPWQPRRPSASNGSDGSDENGGSDGNGDGSSGDRPAWGSQWSNKQPGRGNGGFGGRPGGNGSGGPGKGGADRGGPGGLRWDPTDPAQRRARYAVLGGIWSLFFALFDFTEIALLLGALSTYWAISALRTPLKNASATDRTGTAGDASGLGTGTGTGAGAAVDGGSGTAPAAPSPASPTATAQTISSKQQTTAAVGGLVAALLALLIVATTFTVQLVYRDYYTCVNDALTKTAAVSCNDLLPKPLEPLFGFKE
ncbi:hypothetical protein [Streptomyces sp. SID14515]|uniref:hypothetical protein n=1 Tax=Streptomyces sp. SID14515 TaxID=2706074 RepID=UPI0013CABE4D|nr:hypothetical protein [Streptomyces sp. SID14515]NEB39783.1 hypothetical protein [Streptomyces sp. SID14515]